MATEAPVVVLIRRGPSKQVRLIRWNTTDDSFEVGQWLKGRLYERTADLSPCGRYMVYGAAKHPPKAGDWSRSNWTAISRPPFFTALGLWFTGGYTVGGGAFLDAKRVRIDLEAATVRAGNVERLCPLEIEPLGRSLLNPVAFFGENAEAIRLERHGWQPVVARQAKSPVPAPKWADFKLLGAKAWLEDWTQYLSGVEKSFGAAQRVLVKNRRHLQLRRFEFLERLSPRSRYQVSPSMGLDLTNADWADFDANDRLLYAEGGKVFSAKWDDAFGWHAWEMADFCEMEFEEVRTPDWATRW